MKLSDTLRGVPPVAIGAFVAFFLLAWAVSYTSITEGRGQPTERAGRYYLNDHGDYIPVSHSEYLHAQALSERSFSLIPGVFFALGVLVNLPRIRTTEATRSPVGAPQP
jgi:hypothetical protein